MRRAFPAALYHQRWHAESTFSRHKRRLGSALTAQRTASQQRETVLRVLTHNLMILTRRTQRVSTEQAPNRTQLQGTASRLGASGRAGGDATHGGC
jgi:hypothetical protein